MSALGKLPRVKDDEDFVVPGDVWNALCDKVEALRLQVTAPLSIHSTAAGTLLSLSIPLTTTVVPVKLTGTETPGGQYKGSLYTGTVNPASGTTVVTLPGTLVTTGTNNALVLNPPELTGSGTNHTLFPGTSSAAVWGTGLKIGTTLEAIPRTALLWIPGWVPPTPRPIYTVLMSINSNGDLAFDGPRFIP